MELYLHGLGAITNQCVRHFMGTCQGEAISTSSSIRKQHPKTFAVGPANTAIESNLPTRESKCEHDESTSTSWNSETDCTNSSFFWEVAKATSRSLARSRTRMNSVKCVEDRVRQLLLLRAF